MESQSPPVARVLSIMRRALVLATAVLVVGLGLMLWSWRLEESRLLQLLGSVLLSVGGGLLGYALAVRSLYPGYVRSSERFPEGD